MAPDAAVPFLPEGSGADAKLPGPSSPTGRYPFILQPSRSADDGGATEIWMCVHAEPTRLAAQLWLRENCADVEMESDWNGWASPPVEAAR